MLKNNSYSNLLIKCESYIICLKFSWGGKKTFNWSYKGRFVECWLLDNQKAMDSIIRWTFVEIGWWVKNPLEINIKSHILTYIKDVLQSLSSFVVPNETALVTGIKSTITTFSLIIRGKLEIIYSSISKYIFMQHRSEFKTAKITLYKLFTSWNKTWPMEFRRRYENYWMY